MDAATSDLLVPDLAGLLHTVNSTFNQTSISEFKPRIARNYSHPPYLGRTIGALLLVYLVFRVARYFTSELPPFGSGLKRLPGPISTLPYVGRVHDVDRMQAWTAFNRFSAQYDGLFSCTLGGETHIWVAREDVAQDLLVKHASISSARADLGAFPSVTEDFKYLPLLGFTGMFTTSRKLELMSFCQTNMSTIATFHRQRRFADWIGTRNVNNEFQGYIGLEMKKFMHDLLATPHDLHYLTHLFCARISSRLAYGSPDSAPEHVINAGKFIGQLGPSGPHTNLLPFLQYLPAWMVPGQMEVVRRQEEEDKLWRALYDQTKEAHRSSGYPKTYVAASLEARERGGTGKPLFENETEAKFAVGMLCIVAIYTIGGPATLFALAMLLHPEWQEKVRKEIDEVVGDEIIDLKHSPLLPTLRAAIKESVRWKSTVPLGMSTFRSLSLWMTDLARRCTTPPREELRI
jgi:hypothetical protein